MVRAGYKEVDLLEEGDVGGSDVLGDEDGDVFGEEVLEAFEEDGFLALFGAVEVGVALAVVGEGGVAH